MEGSATVYQQLGPGSLLDAVVKLMHLLACQHAGSLYQPGAPKAGVAQPP